MSNSEQGHLPLAQLLAYADPALQGAERSEIAAHIALCNRCRDQFIALLNLKHNLDRKDNSFEYINITNSCVPDDLMGDFLGNRLPLHERESFSTHLLTCDGCFERAAYYSVSALKMTEGLLSMEKTPTHFKEALRPRQTERRRDTPSPLQGIIETIGSIFRSPIPAYGFAGALLFFLLIGSPSPQQSLIPLASENFAIYSTPAQSGPSFGFSDAGQKRGEQEAHFSVELDDKLTLRWNAITGATRYTVKISAIASDGTATNIYTGSVTSPTLALPSSRLLKGALYRYRVTGESGQSVFVGTGQFALAE